MGAETLLSQPLLQSSTHPLGVLEYRGREEFKSAKRLQQGKITKGNSADVTSLHFCNVLVAACHGPTDRGSHLLWLGSLGTGHMGGR